MNITLIQLILKFNND